MMKMEPPVIYLPVEAIKPVEMLLKVYSRMDRGRLPCELIGGRAWSRDRAVRELVMSVHRTTHTIPSVGYIVWERRKETESRVSIAQRPEIRDLEELGIEISTELRMPLVAYTGATSPGGLDK